MQKKKLNPTGFVAICQCGEITGAMDYTRTDRKDAGKIIGEWLAKGCTVQPKFVGTWSVTVTSCKCEDAPQESVKQNGHIAQQIK
jgi:(2Fe-2S) ferredoxin